MKVTAFCGAIISPELLLFCFCLFVWEVFKKKKKSNVSLKIQGSGEAEVDIGPPDRAEEERLIRKGNVFK